MFMFDHSKNWNCSISRVSLIENDAYMNGINIQRNRNICIQRSHILGLIKLCAPPDVVRIKVSRSLAFRAAICHRATSNHELNINTTASQSWSSSIMLKYTCEFSSFAFTGCKTKWILGSIDNAERFYSTWMILLKKKKKKKKECWCCL